ncbi:MAG: hypothetical protein KGH63_01400 [Candidatus Micrarchaeota archaeon]|nr:hypothetical protein [Candidatus Micrarchaeota archaeon]
MMAASLCISKPSFRKGFFFTVLALVLVSFMFISIQLWAQDQQVSEQRQAERFRLEALQTSLALINNDSLNRFANASMLHAIFNLSGSLEEHPNGAALPCAIGPSDTSCSVQSPPRGPYPDGTYYVNTSIAELMQNGTTSGHIYPNPGGSCGPGPSFYPAVHGANCNLTYSPDERKYLLSNYFNQTTRAAALLGYNLTWGPVEHFVFNQTGTWTLGLHFSVNATLTDRTGTVNITKHLDARVVMDVNGLTDPLILRSDQAYRTPAIQGIAIDAFGSRPHRVVYHVPDYNTPADANASVILNRVPAGPGAPRTVEGLGWFFGPVTSKDNTSFTSTTDPVYNTTSIGAFIYKTGDDAKAVQMSAYFGAVLLEGASDPSILSNYYYNGSFIDAGCNFTVYRQPHNCLDCILWERSNDTSACLDRYTIAPDSVPINPAMPYAAVSGTVPLDANDANYHLSSEGETVVEMLMDSHNNATDLMGSQFKIPTSNTLSAVCDPRHATQTLLDKWSDNSCSNTTLWDMTGPRDMAICGFYVKSQFGPSYLQRYTQQPPYLYRFYTSGTGYSSLSQGIESFVVGKWAGGALDNNAQDQSPYDSDETRARVDYLFYQGPTDDSPRCNGFFEKGLPGCKSFPMCTATDTSTAQKPQSPRGTSVGRFSLTPGGDATGQGPMERYGLTQISIYNPFQTCK